MFKQKAVFFGPESVPQLLAVDDFSSQIRTKNLKKLGKDERLNTLQSALVELAFICLVAQKVRMRISLYALFLP